MKKLGVAKTSDMNLFKIKECISNLCIKKKTIVYCTALCTLVHIYVRETRLSLRNRVTHLCKSNVVTDLKTKPPPHIGYHAECGRSTSNGTSVRY